MTLPLASHTQDNCPARQCLYRGPNSCRAFGPFDWSPPVATDIPRLTFRALKKEICIFGRGQSLLHSHSEAKQTRTQHQQVIKEILEELGMPKISMHKTSQEPFQESHCASHSCFVLLVEQSAWTTGLCPATMDDGIGGQTICLVYFIMFMFSNLLQPSSLLNSRLVTHITHPPSMSILLELGAPA